MRRQQKLGAIQRQTHQQTQKLSTAQQQSLNLLQMNAADLRAMVDAVALENPLLALEPSAPQRANGDKPAPTVAAVRQSFPPLHLPAAAAGRSGVSLSDQAKGAALDDMADQIAETPSLAGHLQTQVATHFDDAVDRALATAVIDQLDENGYLRTFDEDLTEALGIPDERLQSLLTILRQFDPPGIFARDLADCLTLQLLDQDAMTPAMARLLERLPMVESSSLTVLSRACDVDEDAMRALLQQLRRLQPYPAASFTRETPAIRVPDLIVTQRGHGPEVQLNPEVFPRLSVNTDYASSVRQHGLRGKDAAFVRDRLHQAKSLVKAVARRAETLLQLGQFIANHQQDFFQHGAVALKPLTMQQAAESLSLHDSTVSRAVAGKYLSCPFGVFSVRFFFSAGHADAAIQSRISALIQNEGLTPLSDAALAQALQADGLQIARRTVTKYREKAGIPSSYDRRKQAQRRD